MEKRDYIEKQIDQLGQALKALFQMLSKTKEKNDIPLADELDKYTKRELGLDFAELFQLGEKEIVPFLIKEKGFSNGHLEQLADVVFLLGTGDIHLKQSLSREGLQKIELAILKQLSQVDTNYSLARHMRITALETTGSDRTTS